MARVWRLLAYGSVLFLLGCGSDWKAEITSSTRWYGVYGGASGVEFSVNEVSGAGNKTIDLPDDDRVCCGFVQEGSGFLKVEIKDKGGGLFHLFAEDTRSGETNINGGEVQICSEGSAPTDFLAKRPAER